MPSRLSIKPLRRSVSFFFSPPLFHQIRLYSLITRTINLLQEISSRNQEFLDCQAQVSPRQKGELVDFDRSFRLLPLFLADPLPNPSPSVQKEPRDRLWIYPEGCLPPAPEGSFPFLFSIFSRFFLVSVVSSPLTSLYLFPFVRRSHRSLGHFQGVDRIGLGEEDER